VAESASLGGDPIGSSVRGRSGGFLRGRHGVRHRSGRRAPEHRL